ncbi:hypothetical protein [Palleronia pelagia]|uniref:Uncharacterized protein n=1 Tax=Palleronia pelagia TaxID=387096 RepID=A0A1H8HVC9_9RHOB|nr:hypothetical protein [Palleronia pelagia]SEN60340.1 hypothetical protein SAMN04488011_10523 [Palleronia pelagia]
MKISNPLAVLRSIFPQHAPEAATGFAARWSRAFARDEELMGDLIVHGGLMVTQPVQMDQGFPSPAPIDPYRLAYEAGRRDLAVQLLSAGNVTHTDIQNMLKEQRYDD